MRSEIDYHLKRADEKLRAAEHLYEGEFYNDAASRAYYSMYHAATALLLTKTSVPRTHKELIVKFGLEFVKKDIIDEWYGRALSNEKQKREIGDYDATRDITDEEAEDLIENAKRILTKIKKVIKEMKNTRCEKRLKEKGG